MKSFLTAIALVSFGAAANAATVSIGIDTPETTSVSATVSTSGKSGVRVYDGLARVAGADAFCATRKGSCAGKAVMRFDEAVSDLSLTARGMNRKKDRTLVKVYAGDTLLKSIVVKRNGAIDLDGLEGITHVRFVDKSKDKKRKSAGGIFGGFEATPMSFVREECIDCGGDDVSVIPVPAGFPLLLGGLGLLAFARRKRA